MQIGVGFYECNDCMRRAVIAVKHHRWMVQRMPPQMKRRPWLKIANEPSIGNTKDVAEIEKE
jgi:hypothetical protein